MKKKVVLSEEALKAMVGSPTPTQAADEENLKLDASGAENEGKAPEAKAPEADVTPTAEEQVIALTAQVVALTTEAADAVIASAAVMAEAVEAHEVALAKAEAAADDLKQVVCGQLASMRVAIGTPAVDMTDFSAEAVATEYEAVSTKFAQFPVGTVVPEPEPKAKLAPALSSSAAAAIEATGL